jgi:glyoxylase-like metal-dependent hydrolase (beta-lactamase superfamily II)
MTINGFHEIALGPAKAYLIKGRSGYILVDAGSKSKVDLFFNSLRNFGIRSRDIGLIIITHVHFDHVGGLAVIKDACQCPVLVHETEAVPLEKAQILIPPPARALGRFLGYLSHKMIHIDPSFTAVKPEITIKDEYALNDYGIDGSVYWTPGHTSGSLSVIMRNGEAFVGDLAANYFMTVFPLFANDRNEILTSWKKIIDRGAKVIHPSHGRQFGINKLSSELARHMKTHT